MGEKETRNKIDNIEEIPVLMFVLAKNHLDKAPTTTVALMESCGELWEKNKIKRCSSVLCCF